MLVRLTHVNHNVYCRLFLSTIGFSVGARYLEVRVVTDAVVLAEDSHSRALLIRLINSLQKIEQRLFHNFSIFLTTHPSHHSS